MSLCNISKLAAVVAMSFVLSSAALAGSPVTTPNTPSKGNAGKVSTTDSQSQSQTQSAKVDTQLGGNSKGSGTSVKGSDSQSQGSQSQSQTVDKGYVPSKLPSKVSTSKGDKGDAINKGANKAGSLSKTNKKPGDN